MISAAPVVVSLHEAFESLLPQLESRHEFLARREPDQSEVVSEMLAAAWANFRSKHNRTGHFLPPGLLAHMAWRWYVGGRCLGGYSVSDALPSLAVRYHRPVARIDESKLRLEPKDDLSKMLAKVLSSNTREGPAEKAANRIDWSALAARLPDRLRFLLQGLAAGNTKAEIAKALHVSRPAVSQMMRRLRVQVLEFFGEDGLDLAWSA